MIVSRVCYINAIHVDELVHTREFYYLKWDYPTSLLVLGLSTARVKKAKYRKYCDNTELWHSPKWQYLSVTSPVSYCSRGVLMHVYSLNKSNCPQ